MSSSRIGLSLSGGGYRATAFHLGTLRKLDDLGILSRVNVMSTISGGSITGAGYAASGLSYPAFEKNMIETVAKKNLILQALTSRTGLQTLVFFAFFIWLTARALYSAYPWLAFVTIAAMFYFFLRFQFLIFPVSKEIEKLYAKYITKGIMLGALNTPYDLVVGSTNLQTARPFVYTKTYMGDTAYQYRTPPIKFLPANFPLARAVMASSCVPFAFSPVSIGKEFFQDPALADQVNPVIVDGGVYDNQGIHKVMQDGKYACDIVITSDAGNKLSSDGAYRNMIDIALRSMNVFMTRIKNAQMVSDVFDNHYQGKKEIAYISLGWDVKNCIPGFIRNLVDHKVIPEVISHHQLKEEWIADPKTFSAEIQSHLERRINYGQINIPTDAEVDEARHVGTNLTPLKMSQIESLMKQAAALTEIQVKLYCPSLIA